MSGRFYYVRLADGRWLADRSRAPWRWSERERLAFTSAEEARRARDAVVAAWNGAEVVSEAARAAGEPWVDRALAAGWKYAPAGGLRGTDLGRSEDGRGRRGPAPLV